jgi:hypothetical protein
MTSLMRALPGVGGGAVVGGKVVGVGCSVWQALKKGNMTASKMMLSKRFDMDLSPVFGYSELYLRMGNSVPLGFVISGVVG